MANKELKNCLKLCNTDEKTASSDWANVYRWLGDCMCQHLQLIV